MKLSDCTKSDLLFVIKRAKEYGLGSVDWPIEKALIDLKTEKLKNRLDKANEQAKIAHDSRVEYIELLKPYEGMRLIDIPEEVILKADTAMKRAQKADKEWDRLMKMEDSHDE